MQYEGTFSNWEINPDIPDAVFEFTPSPNGCGNKNIGQKISSTKYNLIVMTTIRILHHIRNFFLFRHSSFFQPNTLSAQRMGHGASRGGGGHSMNRSAPNRSAPNRSAARPATSNRNKASNTRQSSTPSASQKQVH